jgi:GGDEF domain-containing protein
MPIDSFIPLVFGLFIKLVLRGMFLVSWLRTRGATWFAWWSASPLFGMLVTGTPVKAPVSLGIASTEALGYDLDLLMRRADMAVYAAKRAGGNRVMMADDPAVVATAS